ncbi:(2Fe-2S)-binding protein [candidate division WOR-3 bacterium]|uniref:(2Fe-2S)-binding protein n=1 Tax=candidate division WOR-3 bacterium TaxID=2052148 RepID=A0A660SHY5_UNCW3|nr:MAG: (2Fe-2S)-binding protein [candidate division WOR-3 bacterium]
MKSDFSEEKKIVCRCEDLTAAEIIKKIKEGYHTFDELKRVIRCGAGMCQGRTCRDLIMKLLAQHLNRRIEDLPHPTIRPPIKPIPLKSFQ